MYASRLPIAPGAGPAAARSAAFARVRPAGLDAERPAPAQLGALIVEIAASRSRPAFIALFQHFAPRLKGWLMRSGVDEAAAEEIAQETMLAVWRKADRFDITRAAASTWIFTIARNLRIDRQRRTQRARAGQQVLDLPDDEADPSPSGEDILIAARQDDELRAALNSLPAEQAAILRLAFFNEWSHAHIAQSLDIPLGTVKSRIRRAIEQLRRILDRAP